MPKNLLLVDYENVRKLDLSVLDESFRAIIFVGASQNPPRAATNKATAHRFTRVDFQKIEGNGKNALDFHIALELGRILETAPDTVCTVMSGDKGFDPLLLHLNRNGLTCRRVNGMDDLLLGQARVPAVSDQERVVCKRCKKVSTIEHHGGRWCTNCGCFASPPDPKLLPSLQPGYRDHKPDRSTGFRERGTLLTCGWCHQSADMSDGIYDDGEWMCGGCVSGFAR